MLINTSKLWKGCLVFDLIMIPLAALAFSGLGLSLIAYIIGVFLSFTPYPLLSLAIVMGLQFLDIGAKIFIARFFDKTFLHTKSVGSYVSLQGLFASVVVINILIFSLISWFLIRLDIGLWTFIMSIIQSMAYIIVYWLCGTLLNKAVGYLFPKKEATSK